MYEPVPTEPPALTAAAAAASALITLAEHAPTRARSAMATALAELAPEDWAWLGLLHSGHAHSPNAALSRVLALAAARLFTSTIDTDALDHWVRPAIGVEVVEVPVEVEISEWARHLVREDCYDLRLHAEPSPATDAMRTTSAAIAARARHRLARHPDFASVTTAATETGTDVHARWVA